MTATKANGAAKGGSIPSAAVLGEMVWLYLISEMHRAWPVGSIHQWLLPALMHRQYRIYHKGKKPVGLVTWAWMSREVEEAYVRNVRSLRPDGWKSGDRGWILDYIAPFGDAFRIGEDLKNSVFANDMGRYLRVRKGSDTMKISYLHGIRRLADAKDHSMNPTVELKTNADVAGEKEPE